MSKVYILGKVEQVPDKIYNEFQTIWLKANHKLRAAEFNYDFALWYYYQGRKHKEEI